MKLRLPRMQLGPCRSLALLASLVAATMGCASRGQSDVYRQKMAGEIRNLEDQLYEADYHNRVLQDRLEIYERKLQDSRIDVRGGNSSDDSADYGNPKPLNSYQPESYTPLPTPVPGPLADSKEPSDLAPSSKDFNSSSESPSSDVFDPPIIDDSATDPAATTNESQSGKNDPIDPLEQYEDIMAPPVIDLGEPAEEPLNDPKPSTDDPALPPTEPRPPLFDEIQIPDVMEGDIQPPAIDVPENPPGKIQIPDSLESIPVPTSLRINRRKTRGRFEEDALIGADVIVEAVDRSGRAVDLRHFDIDAEILVEAFADKPQPTSSQPAIDRWIYSKSDIASLMTSDGLGFHLPLALRDHPAFEKSQFHLRVLFKGQDMRMRCQADLELQPSIAAETWTPRR
ncbi:MAG: hypothetical protein AAF664_16420 [Planctomycetota bacterium]